jgi:hypothetical protein
MAFMLKPPFCHGDVDAPAHHAIRTNEALWPSPATDASISYQHKDAPSA